MNKKLILIIDRHIKGTPRKGYVKDLRVKVCEMPRKIKSKVKVKDHRVYITTKSLKHMYDVRSAQEFDFIIAHVGSVISHPLRVYKNKEGKTGDICFYSEFGDNAYFYILDNQPDSTYIVSAYRLSEIEEKRKNYLAGYKLLWSWKVDLPSS